MASSELVTLKSGLVADAEVVRRLLDLEARGCRFVLLDNGRFQVTPPDLLTDEDRGFLRQRRDEARQVLVYCERITEAPC